MHLLIIPSFYKNNQNKVAGSFFEEQAKMLRNNGIKVGVICFNYYSFSSRPHSKAYFMDDEGIPTYYYNYKVKFPKFRKLNYFLFGRNASKKINAYIKKHGQPNLIHAHNVYYAGIAAFYTSKKLTIPYFITEHSTNFLQNEVSNAVDLRVAKFIYNAAAQVICVSSTFKQDLVNFFKLNDTKVAVVHNLVAPIFFEDLVRNPANPKGLIFYCNAFYCERKNTIELLIAFSNYLMDYPEGKLILSGGIFRDEEKNYQELVNQTIEKYNLNNNVVQLGVLSRLQVKEQIQRSHVSILTSIYETFGVSLIESLAQGKPIITTNSKGPLDIVNSSNGILVNAFNNEAIAEAMKRITKNYTNYNSTEISKDCYSRFSEPHIFKQVFQLYTKALG